MQLREISDGKYWIIEVAGDVDASSSIYLDQAIENALNTGYKNVLIDGTKMQYIASAGLGVFVSRIEEFKDKGINFVIFGLSDRVKNVFQILGLDKLLSIVATLQQAKNP
jgi:anti-sigma B factor antagonist